MIEIGLPAPVVIPLLKDQLKVLGWSQGRCGERIGFSIRSVNLWCTGRVPTPKVVTLYLAMLIEQRRKAE